VLQPTGLKATQFIALQTIEQAGELPQWQFARQHAVAVETLSRRLAVLRRRGLVSVRTGRNHCERIYRLTEEGKMALARAMPYWERAQERLRRTLGDDETQMLLRLCENTVAATQEAEELRTSNGNSEAVRITSRSSVTLSALPASTTIPKTSKSLMRAA
jgi:DNA-binding MarR family transcriptional regulator